MQGHGVGVPVVGRDQEQLVGAVVGRGQRGRVGVVAPPDLDAEPGEALGLRDVAHDDDEVGGGHALEEVVDGGAVEGAGRSGDDDHGGPS